MATLSVSKTARAAARKAGATRRRKASKQKFVQVGQHKLTAEQHREYLIECEKNDPDRALKVVLWRSRPSVQAHKQFSSMVLWRRANRASSALGGLKDLDLWTGDVELVGLYNAVIERLAGEFQAVGQELASIHGAIAEETREGLSREEARR